MPINQQGIVPSPPTKEQELLPELPPGPKPLYFRHLLLVCWAAFTLVMAMVLMVVLILKDTFKTTSRPLAQVTQKADCNCSISPEEMKLASMSAREKIGQLLLTTPGGLSLSDKEKVWLANGEVGGFLLLGKNIQNPKQLASLTRVIETAATPSGERPLVAIDQEGGRVSRISWVNATSQASIKTTAQAAAVAINRGHELQDLGITMNLAPVVESRGSKPSFITLQGRTFAGESSELGIMTVRGYLITGIIPVVKHFPGGLSRTMADPHLKMPSIAISADEFADDLVSFKKVIDAGAPVVMVTHLKYPQFDAKPTSSSSYFITEVLRNDLGFKGVVMIDDLSMGAVTNEQAEEVYAFNAIKAGADVLIVNGTAEYERVKQYLLEQVEANLLTQEELDAATLRVLKLKSNYLK